MDSNHIDVTQWANEFNPITPGSTWGFRVRSYPRDYPADDDQTYVESNTVQFTTPVDVEGVALTTSDIQLTWDNVKNLHGDETDDGYIVEYSTSSDFSGAVSTTFPADHTSAATETGVIHNLDAATTYHFRVRATNGDSQPVGSNEITVTTHSTTLTGTGSDSEIHLSWNAIPNAEYYIIYRSENGGQTFYDPFGPIDGTQWDTGDIGDLAYYVVGVNNGVETAPSNIVYF